MPQFVTSHTDCGSRNLRPTSASMVVVATSWSSPYARHAPPPLAVRRDPVGCRGLADRQFTGGHDPPASMVGSGYPFVCHRHSSALHTSSAFCFSAPPIDLDGIGPSSPVQGSSIRRLLCARLSTMSLPSGASSSNTACRTKQIVVRLVRREKSVRSWSRTPHMEFTGVGGTDARRSVLVALGDRCVNRLGVAAAKIWRMRRTMCAVKRMGMPLPGSDDLRRPPMSIHLHLGLLPRSMLAYHHRRQALATAVHRSDPPREDVDSRPGASAIDWCNIGERGDFYEDLHSTQTITSVHHATGEGQLRCNGFSTSRTRNLQYMSRR